ncbi:phenylacetate--CoA ligase family protein [Bradyrhizobium sp. 41S5]|uniref:phenylacetate--CoA ligase family protein n=1 Tax=Bradyrhizobium sp. 41S5 TaxID=1404443 RepID=UPI00156B38B7|nr:phenylacetate--CoA ligase family protein [Bradyrhizobium sp. 41S5]UFX43968.1 phenylacetate--CoA ligase family protein [Bradyrhizobium sp. 41S5]
MVEQRAFWSADKETRARAVREAEVLGLMQQQLRYAYEHLPFYRRHYDRAGFHPDQVNSIVAFTQRVPIITKQMLRDDQAEHPPFGSYLGAGPVDVCRVHGSLGTSGKPTLYAISRSDWDYISDVMAQAFFTCGVRPGDVVQLATVFSLFMGGWGSLLGIERLGATAFPIGAGETERQIELMWRVKSTVLITTPSYALHMLEVARSMGLDPAASPLRLGIFIGEPGSSIPGTRQALESGWGIVVRDMATTSEMTPWGTNAECEMGQGVHVMQDEVWTEIVAKDNPNHALPDGESGAVVYTHLRRQSQPMIRFYSGDESHMTHAPCGCGRTYPRLPMGVYGRLDDMLLIRGANVYPSQVQRSLLSVRGTGIEFKILLERNGALDTATVRVERDPAAKTDNLAEFDIELAKQVKRRLKNDTNINFEVEVLPPNSLERAISKASRVDDRRPRLRP